MSALKPRPYRLTNKIQHYAWGTRGKAAFIPDLLGIAAQADLPYAELWMGAHPKAPSEVAIDGRTVPLDRLVAQHPLQMLGRMVCERFSAQLPFLFKVLSIGEALSIQAHPDKEQAQVLHAQDPEHYLDENHKPEVAIALDSLTALVGFKSFPDIIQSLWEQPELAGFVGEEVVSRLSRSRGALSDRQQDLIRQMYSAMLKRSTTCEGQLVEALDQLESRLRAPARPLREEEQLFLDLRRKYMGADAGLFSVFLFNLVHLGPGQAVYIAAGIPHGYLRGNIVECMANSDNVVRAGLTPKFRDVEALVEILSYQTGTISPIGECLDQGDTIYRTPAQEFEVTRWRVDASEEREEKTGDRPQILLVTSGSATVSWGTGPETGAEQLSRGQSVFIPAALKEFRIASGDTAELFKVGVPPPA